jgi:prophage tail gpP-like protein
VQIQPGSPCEVAVDGEIVITGFVDDAGVEFDPTTHEVEIAGRDATGDLVDCAAFVPGRGPSIWADGSSPLAIIAGICRPFKIAVKADVPMQATGTQELTPGETAFCVIDRLARGAGVLPVSDGQGRLLLTRGGSGGSFAPIREGENIEKAKGAYSFKQRFSDYYVVSQLAGDYVDATPIVSGAHATDPAITRFRPVVIQAETPAPGAASPQRRAEWEASVRIGKALRYTLTLTGWRDDSGALWQPNGLVPVTSRRIGWTMDENGSVTELTVTRPDAFKLIPLGLIGFFDADYSTPGPTGGVQ